MDSLYVHTPLLVMFFQTMMWNLPHSTVSKQKKTKKTPNHTLMTVDGGTSTQPRPHCSTSNEPVHCRMDKIPVVLGDVVHVHLV